MRGAPRKYLMKADYIEKVGLLLCNTRKNFCGASPFKYECLIHRDVNRSYTKWFTTKIEHCYLSIEQCEVAPSNYMFTKNIENLFVLLASLSTLVEKIAGLKVTLRREIEEQLKV